jgi:hypothetical protein
MRATWQTYGDQEVSLLWNDETGWSVGWGPAGGECGASYIVCRSLVPEPGEVVDAARAALTAPPAEDVPCPFRSSQEHDEELETLLDTYTRREMTNPKEPTMTDQTNAPEPRHCVNPTGKIKSGSGSPEDPFILDLGGDLRPYEGCGCQDGGQERTDR